MTAFYCGTCGWQSDIGVTWHCTFDGQHVPVGSAHCGNCGASRPRGSVLPEVTQVEIVRKPGVRVTERSSPYQVRV